MPRYRLRRFAFSPRWYITWSEGRRTRRASTGEGDRDQAELVLAAFRLERTAHRRDAEPAELGIATLLDDYIERHARHLASAQQATIAARHLKTFFGLLAVDRLEDAGLAEEYARWRGEHASGSTIARELSVLRAALRRRLHGRAPRIPAPAVGPERTRWLTRAEAARLLWASRRFPWLPTFIRLALYTGARPAAILGLAWDRVDLRHGLVDFRLPGRGEGNKRRVVVPIAGAALRHLAWLDRHRRDDRVVPITKGTLKREFGRVRADAGLGADVTPYTLRHTMGSWAAQAGVDLYRVGRMLGHSKPTTTQRYAKLAPDHLRDVARAALRGPNARNLRATFGGTADTPSPSPIQLSDFARKLVGAAGIEPATPTMSSSRRARNLLILQGVQLRRGAGKA